MKSLFREKSAKTLSMTALLFAVGLSVLGAQNVGPALPDVQINWASPTEAMDRLSQSIGVLEQQVQAGGYSDPLVFKLKYYNAVFISIEQGVSVPVAVDANYGLFVPGVTDAPVQYPNSVPLPTWALYRQELTQLLQN